MATTAIVILAISYLFLFSEKLNRAVAALLGAVLMVVSGVLNQDTAIEGIDFNTIFLLIGMMIMVGISEKSGMFEYAAVLSAKKVNADPRKLLAVLGIITAVLSGLLDNVTTIMLIVPITIQITRKLKVPCYPYLILEIFASNIGGAATLIGDPPNIMIGSALGLSFMDFVRELALVMTIILAILIVAFDWLWKKRLNTTDELRAELLKTDEKKLICNKKLFRQSLTVLGLTIAGFAAADFIKLPNSTVALFGAAILLLLESLKDNNHRRDEKVEEILQKIDWTTIFFFAGLFVIVHGLEVTGVLQKAGEYLRVISKGDLEKASFAVLFFSTVLSAVVDNIPFVAVMIPMLKSVEQSFGGREVMMPLWWAMTMGACLGGNGSLIGASANVIAAGIAARSNTPIHFIKFFIYSLPVTFFTIIIAAIYLKLAYF